MTISRRSLICVCVFIVLLYIGSMLVSSAAVHDDEEGGSDRRGAVLFLSDDDWPQEGEYEHLLQGGSDAWHRTRNKVAGSDYYRDGNARDNTKIKARTEHEETHSQEADTFGVHSMLEVVKGRLIQLATSALPVDELSDRYDSACEAAQLWFAQLVPPEEQQLFRKYIGIELCVLVVIMVLIGLFWRRYQSEIDRLFSTTNHNRMSTSNPPLQCVRALYSYDLHTSTPSFFSLKKSRPDST